MMKKLNKRVLNKKDEILAGIAKGYKPHEVGRVFEIDARTIKRALEIWEVEDAKAKVEAVKSALEIS